MKKGIIILITIVLMVSSIAFAESTPLLTSANDRIILGLSDDTSLLKVTSLGSQNAPQLVLEDSDGVGIGRLRTIDGDVFIEQTKINQPFESKIALLKTGEISLENSLGNIVMLPNGQVGIGVKIPQARLDVLGDVLAGSDESTVRIGANGVELIGTGYEISIKPFPDGSFSFTQDSDRVSRLFVDQNGQIGIGTVEPNNLLHIAGTTQSDDGIIIGTEESAGRISLSAAARNANQPLLFSGVGNDPITSNFIGDISVTNQILFGNGLGRLLNTDGAPQIQLSDSTSVSTLSILNGILTLTGTPLRVPTLQLANTGNNGVVWNIKEKENNAISFDYNGEKLILTASGQLGLGIAPADKLHISGANNNGLTISGIKNKNSPIITLDNPDNPTSTIITARDGHVLDVEYNERNLLTITPNGRVGIGTGTASPSRLFTVQGSANIGGTSSGRLFVRHIDGKSGGNANVDHLFLQHNTGKNVFIGKASNPSNLAVTGTVTSQGKKVCLADGTDCKPSFELSSCNVKTAAFNAGFPTCDTGEHRMAQWCSGDCNGDDAKAVICCEEQAYCEALPSEDHGVNRQCSKGKSLMAAWCSGKCEGKDARVSLCCEGPGLNVDPANYRNPGNSRSGAVAGRCAVFPTKPPAAKVQCKKPTLELFSYKNFGGNTEVTVCCLPSQILDIGLYPQD